MDGELSLGLGCVNPGLNLLLQFAGMTPQLMEAKGAGRARQFMEPLAKGGNRVTDMGLVFGFFRQAGNDLQFTIESLPVSQSEFRELGGELVIIGGVSHGSAPRYGRYPRIPSSDQTVWG